jgi:predicted GNAT family N-acyltransferase
MSDTEITKVSLQHEKDRALTIRKKVFVREQGIAEEEEYDGKDADSTHYLLCFQGKAVGTARTRRIEDNKIKIERVAILKQFRGKGLGHRLMQFILEDIKDNKAAHCPKFDAPTFGCPKVYIGSQKHAIPFYEKLGFTVCSNEYTEAGISHKDMQLIL